MVDESKKKADEDWQKTLTAEQYHICRLGGTERPFSGEYWDAKMRGTYLCICCGAELFSSSTKFESGTGWPSFFAPIDKANVKNELDLSHGMRRFEVRCANCNAHLGHVFNDGPKPTGLRYCINSASLKLRKDDDSPA